ncbi:hypothetical protein QYF36_027280 [Acer negundo]|nr:hypothetical protein QYF36_027280 [Acer negundo]
MNRFQFYCLFVLAVVTLLLVFTPRIQAARTSFPSPATRNQHQDHHHYHHQQKQQQESTFQPSATVPISSISSTTTNTNTTREFESQKRRVPTGSNPLHNKRR